MGSVPIHIVKLYLVSIVIAILAMLIGLYIYIGLGWILGIIGALYFVFIEKKYRNPDEKHSFEEETKITIDNFQKSDTFIKKLTGLKNSRMMGAKDIK